MSHFQTELKDKLHVIKCPGEFSTDAISEFNVNHDNWIKVEALAHVFDFSSCKNLDGAACMGFIRMKKNLASTSTPLFSINIGTDILKFITESGLEKLFSPVRDYYEILTKLGIKSRNKLGTPEAFEFLKPFISSVQIALSTQANTPVTVGKPFSSKTKFPEEIAIAGVIQLSSEQFTGSISLLFPKKVFIEVYKNMLGEDLTEITQESQDAAGELLNIIFGLAKMKLNNSKGYTIQKAIPTVFVGDKIKLAQTTTSFAAILPFETKVGSFFVEVTFDQN